MSPFALEPAMSVQGIEIVLVTRTTAGAEWVDGTLLAGGLKTPVAVVIRTVEGARTVLLEPLEGV